jgi:hypothetical protein
MWLYRIFAPLSWTEEILGLYMLCLIVSVDVILPLEVSLAARFGAVVASFWLISTRAAQALQRSAQVVVDGSGMGVA